MALVTHQVQGSYATIPLRPLSWSRGFKVKQHLTMLHMVGKTDRHFVGKHNLHSRQEICDFCLGYITNWI
uniref:Uncharacterized protein n=1 Tax=Rhizophora mucronata TaxID=61149 RepID=A0A2P2KZK2_RHIMU